MKLVDEDGWRWVNEIGGEGYLSPTTILSNAVANPKLSQWYKKTSEKKIYTTVNNAADFGTKAHEYFENILNNKEFTPEETHKLHIEAFKKWILEEDLKVIGTEMAVTSNHLGISGTTDCIATIKGDMCVLDWKTGNRYSVTNGWQLALYRMAAIEMGLVEEDCGMMGVQISRDKAEIKTFKYQHIDFCEQAFIHALGVFKALYFNKLQKLNWKWLKEAM